ALRDPADLRLHRAALSPEVRRPPAGRSRSELLDQAGCLPGGDGGGSARVGPALEPRRSRRGRARRARAGGRVAPAAAGRAALARVELVVWSGAPRPAAVAALWQAWGVNVCEAYGQTETGGALVSGQRGPYPRPGDVGTVAPSMKVELDPDGEILVTAAEFFGGYWRDPDAPRALYREGKLATGDVGEWTAAGSLKLVDRKRDILITAGGKNVSPSLVENRLRASPYISDAAVFGEARKYLVALLEADGETVAEWAR